MSVQAVVSALKLKLPLLWAKAGTTPNTAMTSATERIMADFIRDLLEWEDHENPGGMFRPLSVARLSGAGALP